MRTAKIILLIVSILFLPACVAESRLEQTAIINSRGVDLIEGNGKKIIETTIIPFIFDPNADESTSLLIGRGDTIKEARSEAEKLSPFPLEPGKINMDFYGPEAAKAGILPFLNTLIRDARVSDRMQLAITPNSAREFLEKKQNLISENTTEYLKDLTRKEVEASILPRHSLEYFSRLVTQVGIDPVLPILSFKEGKPAVIGIALFEDDRYVGEASLGESFLINQLREKTNNSPIEAMVPANKYEDVIVYESEYTENEQFVYLSFNLKKGTGKIKIDDFDTLRFKAKINMRADLLETSIPMDIKDEKMIKRLEKDIEAYYQKEYETLFKKLQEVKSDAFGVGRTYVATRQGSKTTNKEWREKYPNASMDFDVEFKIIHIGTID